MSDREEKNIIDFDSTNGCGGKCASCHRIVTLINRTWCPVCGSSRGLLVEADDYVGTYDPKRDGWTEYFLAIGVEPVNG